jgi:hypothetical protein
VSAAPGCEFPNPCPVCGATDDHAERMGDAARYSPATLCPHPAEPGHGTGCCCAGISRETRQRQIQEAISRPTLEDRVAALERRFAPLQITYSSVPSLTEAELDRLKEDMAEALELGPLPHVMPPDPPLSPAQVRYLIRQCVTVVNPGETLVIQDPNWTPSQIREIQNWMDREYEDGRITFKVLAVPGGELGIAQTEASTDG